MGNKNNLTIVKIPEKVNEELAELVGAYLGDGTLTKYFIRISGDKRYDVSYIRYLAGLVENVFEFKPAIRFENNTNIIYLEIRSKMICDFFHKKLKILYGDKIRNKTRIPEQILGDKNLLKACIRGLVDTDGSICRRDNYICLTFNSYNGVILEQVELVNKDLKLFTHRYKDEIGTNSWKAIINFYKEVGSSNLRHIIRFRERHENNKCLYKKETKRYFNKYKGIKLPYKLGPMV